MALSKGKDTSRLSDPAARVKSAPPNFGRDLLPHPITFVGFVSSISHAYRASDEALKDSLENARFMRSHALIMECLEARQRGTALLNWHLEPEDAHSDDQLELCDKLTRIIACTPRFTEYRRWLLEAIWFGRAAAQNTFGWDLSGGRKRLYVRRWLPIHGDKLIFRFDNGTGEYDPDQVGIKFTAYDPTTGSVGGKYRLEPTDYGMAYFLKPWERSLITLHRHMIEDAPFEDPQSAGRIHGVGIRDRIYWTWYQMIETQAMLMELIERTGQGFNIWYYPAHDPAAKAETEKAAKEQSGMNNILIPRTPGDPAFDGYGYDRIEPSGAGVEALKMIIHEFFGHQIKRYILGQTLSSEADATGLGSGVADLHLESFLQIIRYDATNLEETLTTDFVEPLKRYNFPKAANIRIRFKIDTEAADTQEKLQSMQTAWSMGARIKASDVFDAIGISMPGESDEVLENPQLAHLAKLGEMRTEQMAQEAGLAPGGESPQQALLPVVEPQQAGAPQTYKMTFHGAGA